MLSKLKTFAKPLIKRVIISAGLEATPLIAPLVPSARGRGAIFTLHHVRPTPTDSFRPNAILDLTPEFLEQAILTLRQDGYRFIPLGEVRGRLAQGGDQKFACFTLDDGCRDNAECATPVFTRLGVPFTMFLTKGFIDATHSMWWETLAGLLNAVERLEFDFGGGADVLRATTRSEKQAAFDRIAAFINASDEAAAVARLDDAARRAGIEPLDITRTLTLREEDLRRLAQNPLVSYGAHTVSHRGLARLSVAEAEREIAESVERVAAIAGRRPESFAYPYGDGRSVSERERQIVHSLGLKIAVTTRPGTLNSTHASHATAVPRISLNGHYQKARYVRALASGVPFKLMG
jgi:peptidoglycan/xylan/chitin deacetylase (PgdA/CDA1 family)